MSDKPSKFEDFDVEVLRAIAVEEFGVEVGPNDNKKELLAALVEDGVTWDNYVANHPDAKAKPEKQLSVKEAVKNISEQEIITATNPVNNADAKYLVIMERDNPLFEISGYRFTNTNPYALVTADAADKILKEPGFRLAGPGELKEFYA